jgi:cellulose 1,4-beta-cellobiosidase
MATYRYGDHQFYGQGPDFKVDSQKMMTVVTQFITHDNSDSGEVVEIRRKYVQDGKVIESPKVTIGDKEFDSITDEFCEVAKDFTSDPNDYAKKGGLKRMSKAFDKGMVLVMSLWDDAAAGMLWLDGDFPKGQNPSDPGVARGPCGPNSGDPATVRREHPDAYVTYSNIKFGEIDSTYGNHITAQEFLQ